MNLENVYFAGLYCIILMQFTVQKQKTKITKTNKNEQQKTKTKNKKYNTPKKGKIRVSMGGKIEVFIMKRFP
jgi:hypothetical protein